MKFTIDCDEKVDLTDYGHDEDVRWVDLSEDEQNEIRDILVSNTTVSCYYDVKNNLKAE